MTSTTAGKRYAQAIFAIASEHNTIDAWLDDLSAIAEVSRHPRATEYLNNPKIAVSDKESVAVRLFPTVQPEAMNLVRMLVARHRLDLAPSIFTAFENTVNEMRGITEAEVTTAVTLSETEADEVRTRLVALTGNQIILTRRVDEAIIGGLIARIGDQMIDGSTRTRLAQLRRSLANATR